MIHRSLLHVVTLLAAAEAAGAAEPAKCVSDCPAPIVFFDIAGPDTGKLRTFYATVFKWSIDARNAIDKASTGLEGTLREDPAEKVIYLGVPDVTAALAAVVAAGGSIVAPRFEVPGVVILGLFKDPAGNRLGLVEMQDGKAKIPPPGKQQ
jgi:predicted enzyme related to lactoylglutathione lyase